MSANRHRAYVVAVQQKHGLAYYRATLLRGRIVLASSLPRAALLPVDTYAAAHVVADCAAQFGPENVTAYEIQTGKTLNPLAV